MMNDKDVLVRANINRIWNGSEEKDKFELWELLEATRELIFEDKQVQETHLFGVRL